MPDNSSPSSTVTLPVIPASTPRQATAAEVIAILESVSQVQTPQTNETLVTQCEQIQEQIQELVQSTQQNLETVAKASVEKPESPSAGTMLATEQYGSIGRRVWMRYASLDSRVAGWVGFVFVPAILLVANPPASIPTFALLALAGGLIGAIGGRVVWSLAVDPD